MKTGFMKAKLIGAGVSETKTGKARIFMKFGTEDGEIYWQGFISSPKAEEITARTLVQCGFIGNDWADMGKGIEAFAIPESGHKIKVVEETYEGVTRFKVSWAGINSPRSKAVVASNTGLFAQIKQDLGMKKEDTFNF
jgi:hypothetical protein